MNHSSIIQLPTSDLSSSIIENENQIIFKKSTTIIKPPSKIKIEFNYREYFKEIKNNINDYKLTELREIAKYNKIKGAKSKQEFIQKINEHFFKICNIIKIQKVCRGFLVRYFFKIKGGINSFKTIKLCVNETDFYTLDPINDMDFFELFIFKEEQCPIQKSTQEYPTPHQNDEINTSFYYGFNVKSLISMYKKNGTIINPYNRKSLPIETIQNIFSHYLLLLLLFKEHTSCDDSIDNIIKFKVPTKKQIRTLFVSNSNNEIQLVEININNTSARTIINTILNSVIGQNIDVDALRPMEVDALDVETYLLRNFQFEPFIMVDTNEIDETIELENIRNKITLFKQQPLNTRINELFMYIDQLGNYTNSTWFSELNKRKYYLFYSQLRELWTFRAEIPSNIKNKICPLGDPFLQSSAIFRKPYDQITDDEICKGCLDVIENIIMTSLDIEYRKIGCLHVLTALTVVSLNSRIQYGYLFDLLESYNGRHIRW
jgi:hypothetical protein